MYPVFVTCVTQATNTAQTKNEWCKRELFLRMGRMPTFISSYAMQMPCLLPPLSPHLPRLRPRKHMALRYVTNPGEEPNQYLGFGQEA